MSRGRCFLSLFLLLTGLLPSIAPAQNIQGFPTGSLWIFGKIRDTNNPVFNLSQLVAYWDMNETSGAGEVVDGGATRMDVTCHGWNAAPYNPAFINASAMGLISNALSAPLPTVNGLGVSAAMDTSPTGLTPFSFQLWMQFLADRSGNTVAGEWGGSSNQWRLVYQGTIPGFQWIAVNTNGGSVTLNSASTNLVVGNWYHIVITFDGSIRTLYVNTLPTADTNLTRVCRGFGGGLKFADDVSGVQIPACRIDECGYWNVALSAQQVTNLFNNGAGLQRGPGPCACHVFAGPYINYVGGIVSMVNSSEFYNSIYLTVDGTLPDSTRSLGGISAQLYNNGHPPAGTYTFDANFTVPWGPTNTIIAIGSAGSGCNRRAYIQDSAFVTNIVPSLGALWTNNVVLAGGTLPATANSQTNIDLLGGALNNAGIAPFITVLNLVCTDSLAGAQSPQIYVGGSQPWVNHAFVAGDLTINGLTGNGSTKYLDTGLQASAVHTTTSGGLAVYAYATNTTFNADDLGAFDGTTADDLAANNGAGKFQTDLIGSSNGRLQTVPTTNGFFAGERTSASVHTHYFANSSSAFASVGSNATASDGTPPADNFFAFAFNSSTTPIQFSSGTISMFEIGPGMTSGQAQSLFNAVQNFRLAEGGGFR